MNPSDLESSSHQARHGDAAWLAHALANTRSRTLAMLAAWGDQRGHDMPVVYDRSFNPMQWEFGHVGWFEEWWLARNSERHLGWQANPEAARTPSIQPRADSWYNSSTVEHRSRWSLGLPSMQSIVDDLQHQRNATLALLAATPHDDHQLYFFRLVLLHENMHAEAWAMMAQALGIDPGDDMSRRVPRRTLQPQTLEVPATRLNINSAPMGFSFDNELGTNTVDVAAFTIDAAPVVWSQFLPFLESGGYQNQQFWTRAGWAWRQGKNATCPRYVKQTHRGSWQQKHFDQWRLIEQSDPVSHVTLHEAQAWCRWAGRRLPTEAQWRAAQSASPRFYWGDVWEWTNTPFAPFDGFEAHPYRDYSLPWFDGRPVLKGASVLTHPTMKHPSYRNFFEPQRDDVMVGFRSCSPPAA